VPASTVPASAVFVIERFEQFTVIETGPAVSLPWAEAGSFVAATVTRLFVIFGQFEEAAVPETVKVLEAPALIVGNEQERFTELVIEHEPASVPPSVQVIPEGSVSVRVAVCAWPEPWFVSVKVKVAVSPTFRGPLPVLVTVTSGQLTPIWTLETDGEPSLVEEAEAPFTIGLVAQVAEVVGEVMWTVSLAPLAIVEEGQLKVPEAIEQAALHPVWLAIVQERPVFVGRVSERVTPLALPAPVLATVIR